MSDQDIAEAKAAYQAYLAHQAQPESPDILTQAKNGALKGLSTVGRGLDYAGGITRTAGAYPFVKSVTGQDVLNAFKANPLSGNEILKRGGISQGGSLSDVIPSMYNETGEGWPLQKGGWADPTKRGAQGLALEMATDPLALAGGMATRTAAEALQAGRALTPAEKLIQMTTRPIGYALEEAGKKRYASAFNKINAAGKIKDELPMSDVYLQHGMPTGNFNELSAAKDSMQNSIGGELGNIRSQAAQKGATINMLPAMNKSMELAAEWRRSPHPDVRALADKLDEITASYLGRGEAVPVDIAHEWATEANRLGQKVYTNPAIANKAAEGNAAIGQGITQETRPAIEAVSPELKDANNLANKQFSALSGKHSNAQFDSLAKTEASKNAASAVDWGLLGAGVMGTAGGNPWAMAPLVLKKTGEYLNSPLGRTQIGKGLYNTGKYGDQILRRPSVWYNLNQNNNQGENQ